MKQGPRNYHHNHPNVHSGPTGRSSLRDFALARQIFPLGHPSSGDTEPLGGWRLLFPRTLISAGCAASCNHASLGPKSGICGRVHRRSNRPLGLRAAPRRPFLLPHRASVTSEEGRQPTQRPRRPHRPLWEGRSLTATSTSQQTGGETRTRVLPGSRWFALEARKGESALVLQSYTVVMGRELTAQAPGDQGAGKGARGVSGWSPVGWGDFDWCPRADDARVDSFFLLVLFK